LFGIVIAGEVHPQPQFLSFGYAFLMMSPTSKELILVMGKWMSSGDAPLFMFKN
jgi:hypothetical protein